MKRILINLSIISIFIVFLIISLSNPDDIINACLLSTKIFLYNVFPTLFPFFVISDILINYNMIEILSKILSKYFYYFFKINGPLIFIFIMSIISGCPSNAKYTKELLDKKLISIKEANKIILFTHFTNPLFILGVSSTFLNNKNIGLFILIIHYLTNIIIGLIFRNYYPSTKKNNYISFKRILNYRNNFGKILSNSIIKSINTLLLILGTITFFMVVNSIIMNFNIPIFTYFSKITLEMTQGIKYLINLNISLQEKTTLIGMILSFGGFCIHIQVFSILSDYKIKYLPYLTTRLLHSGLTGILIYLLYPIYF